PVGRRALAAVLAVRTGLVRRADRARRRTSDRKKEPWVLRRGWHAGALPRTGAGEGAPARGAPGRSQSPGRNTRPRAAAPPSAAGPAPSGTAAGAAARTGSARRGRGQILSLRSRPRINVRRATRDPCNFRGVHAVYRATLPVRRNHDGSPHFACLSRRPARPLQLPLVAR